jgi:glycosyltransferase involved in cell wall biosynthesis
MISVVIPMMNEEESLAELHRQLCAALEPLAGGLDSDGEGFEIIFVDDGSKDESWAVVKQLQRQDPRVRGIRFRRNFGKAAALAAGFKETKGRLIFTLDADLQDDPAEIPRFLELVDKGGFDCVSGYKQTRHDPWHKVLPSRIFNATVSWLTGVKLHDHNCGFKCYRREIFDEVLLYGELHRFVPVLAAARGWNVTELVVNHRPREFGSSKYGVQRFVKGFLDLLTVKLITGYGQRPQHLLGTWGLFFFFLGGLGMSILTVIRIISFIPWFGMAEVHLHERALFYYCLASLILGAQFVTIGFLAELMTAYHRPNMKVYSIAERLDDENHAELEPSRTEG